MQEGRTGFQGLRLACRVAPGIAGAALAILAGCQYPEPLSTEPEALLDPRILGQWTCATVEQDDTAIRVDVSATGRGQYLVKVVGALKDEMVMPMHLTAYGPARIANLDALASSSPEARWLLLRPTLVRGDLLDLRLVHAQSLSDVREALRSDPDNPRVYRTYAACVRRASADLTPEG